MSKANHYLCQKRAAIRWIELVLEMQLPETDFIETLADGVLLCRVIQTISPTLMPRISIPEPNAPRRTVLFKNSENISFFLQASADMGVPRHKRFALADLQNTNPSYTNIRRIIECLESICKIANSDSQYEFMVEWPVLDPSKVNFRDNEVEEAEKLLAQFTIRETKRQEVIKKSQNQTTDFSVAATKNQLFQHVADQKKMYPDNSPKRSTLGSPVKSTSSTSSSPIPGSPLTTSAVVHNNTNNTADTTTTPTITKPDTVKLEQPLTTSTTTTTTTTTTTASTPTAPVATTKIVESTPTSTTPAPTSSAVSTPTLGEATNKDEQKRSSLEIRAAIRIQRATRRWLERNRQRIRERDNAYRERIAQEMAKTETEYLNRLVFLRDNILKDLREAIRKGQPIISDEEIRAIFSELESIILTNMQIQDMLQARLQSWSTETLIGDIFVKFSSFLKIYSQYSINYEVSMEVLNECKKQPKFKSYLNKIKDKNEEIKLRGLEDYLIRPIQRIPRYSLLLKDMISHTWPTHPDYQSLEKAYVSMNTVAEKMNQAKISAENRMKLADIQEKLDAEPSSTVSVVKAHRRFVKEGEFYEVMTKSKKSPLVLYLFNDILAVTRPSKSGSFFGKTKTIRLQFESSYSLHKLRIRTLEDTNSCTNALKISTSSEDGIVICAYSSEIRDEWVAAILAEKREAEKAEKEQEERITSKVIEKVADTKLKLEQQFAQRTSGQYSPSDVEAAGNAMGGDTLSGSNGSSSGSSGDLGIKSGKMSLREKRMKLVQESRNNRMSSSVSTSSTSINTSEK